MIIYEATPNPNSMKFIVTDRVLSNESLHFSSLQSSHRSPLAQKLFGFPWMSQVLIGSNFITITKQDWVDWTVLADPLVNLLEEHLTQGLPIILPATSGQPLETTKNASELEQQIQQVINEEIRPALALDGGDIIFERFDKGIVYLQMLGSCSGCPSATMTLKEGIETRLKNQFPQVLSVLSIGGS